MVNSPLLTVLALIAAAATQVSPVSAPPELPDDAWASDIVFPDADTIVIADQNGCSHTSTDKGWTWTNAWIGTPISSMSVDGRGVIWGVSRGDGILEPSTASLVWTPDNGKDWRLIELDPEVCKPVGFAPGCKESTFIAEDGQIWRHEPSEPESFKPEYFTDWHRIGIPNPDKRGLSAFMLNGDLLFASSDANVWASSDRGTSWLKVAEGGVCAFFLSTIHDDLSLWVYGYTPDARLLTLQADRLHDPEKRRSVQLKQIGQPLEGISRVHHATRIGSGFAICGERRDGTALAAIADQYPSLNVNRLPGVAGNQALKVRVDPSNGIWVVGKGVYKLATTKDRWELVWPKR